MKYRTPEEIFELIIQADHTPELKPFLHKLELSGSFSNTLAGLIDRMQEDEDFRRVLIVDRKAPLEIGKANFLEAHEVFALVAAATLLDPQHSWPKKSPSLEVAPSPEDLAAKFRDQPLDAKSVRKDRVNQLLHKIIQDPHYMQLVVSQPSLAFGNDDINRAEFFMVYVQAALLHMAKNKEATINISKAFLKIVGITEEDFKWHMNKSWDDWRDRWT